MHPAVRNGAIKKKICQVEAPVCFWPFQGPKKWLVCFFFSSSVVSCVFSDFLDDWITEKSKASHGFVSEKWGSSFHRRVHAVVVW